MANLTKPTFVYTGPDSLIFCQKKYRLNSPYYFRLHINSRIAKFQKNKGMISTVSLRTETSEWITSVNFWNQSTEEQHDV